MRWVNDFDPTLHDRHLMTTPITIIIPVHNEAGFVGPALTRICAEVEGVTSLYRIILVENGSTDRTFEEASEAAEANPRIEVIQTQEADYGQAIRTGMAASPQEGWMVLFDIDYYSGAFIRQVIGQTGQADAVIASKRAPGSRDDRPLIRRLATLVFNTALRKIVGSELSDTHGIKAIRSDLAHGLLPEVVSSKDLFDTELMLRAERAGRRIVEVPIEVREQRSARSSLLRRVPRTLKGLLTLRRILR